MSRLPFELLLALRYLRPKRTFVSVITLISIIGVMLGVAVLIIVISVMTGFHGMLREQLLGFQAHITVKSHEWADYRLTMEKIATHPSVKTVSPFVNGLVMVESQSFEGKPLVFAPFVRGMSSHLESENRLLTHLVEGTNDLRGRGILIGRIFAVNMDLRVGDNLTIYSLPDLQKNWNALKKSRTEGELRESILPADYEVRGIFDVGYYDIDTRVIVCSLVNAQELFDMGDSVTGLAVTLHHPEQARAVRNDLERTLEEPLALIPWQENEDISTMLQVVEVEKSMMFYLLFFIMIVAAFGITSALITFVVQKTREIGILKAVGASRGQIVWIFLSQSLVVGVTGVLTGFGLGLLAVHYRNEFLFFMRRVTSWELFPAEIYGFTQLPAIVDPGDVMLICGGSLLICLLAGLIPAWNAGRLKPVEALRYE